MGSKFYFSQWETYFTQFIIKFLKFEEMQYFIHHFKVEMWPAFCKFPILLSAVKLKLDQTFSQFIRRFKIGSFEFLTFESFQFTKRLKIEIFECSSD